MKKKIAIVGGGVSGLYLAWRLEQLLSKDEYSITIYETEESPEPGRPRLGGRIRTCEIQLTEGEQEVALSAELGAMRYPNRHLMLSSLIQRLGLNEGAVRSPVGGNGGKARGPFDLNTSYYIRGRVLNEGHFADGDIPYGLKGEERGKSPEELLQYAIGRALEQISLEPPDPLFMARLREMVANHKLIEPRTWMRLSSQGVFDDIRLRDIGFWNLIKHFLSSEAFLLCQDGFGFLSVISNWNASEAFKWLIADFSPDQHFLNVHGGFSRLIGGLNKELNGTSVIQGTLQAVAWEDNKFRLDFSNCPPVESDYLVLALPPRALQRVRIDNVNTASWLRLVKSSRPHRLEKIVLAYREPWWKDAMVPGGTSGRVFTDLPMRQIYYFGPDWLAKNGFSEAQDYSLILIYNDSLYEGFWRTFSVYKRVHIFEDIKDEEWVRRALGPLPGQISAPDLEVVVDGAEKVRYRMEEKVRSQLRELHPDIKVPVAIAGVYKDWADMGGWHTWEPFVDVEKTKKVIVQPLKRAGGELRLSNPEDRERIPLFLCGEAYAWEQGWIEGALMTAEALAAELGETLASAYRAPEWINQLGWRDYMCPEFEACPSYDSFKRKLSDR